MGTLEGRVKLGVLQGLGAMRKTNQSSEMVALYWALAWAAQCSLNFDLEVHTDSDVCRGYLAEHQKNDKHIEFGVTLRGLFAAQKELRNAQIFQVKGHNGHAYNELADRLAERAARSTTYHANVPLHGRFVAQRWWMLVLDTRSGARHLPQVIDDHMVVAFPKADGEQTLGDMYARKKKVIMRQAPLTIQAVSVNVLSLAGDYERTEMAKQPIAQGKHRRRRQI